MAGPRISGAVHLVGAGPGDPGLLTLRAKELLQTADVVLFDALVSHGIVDMIGARCERIFVGKRGGDHSMPQQDIEALMIRKAREGKNVVRLKGGDPFVFGRGGEEAEALRAAGIGFSIVPGITSAIAAPAYAGIPITHRDFNTAFTVVTGHEDPEKPLSTLDWKRLADPHQTLVFLMGIGNLPEIARRLIDEGLSADRPAATIMHGTMPSQRTVVATLATIAKAAQDAEIEAPAVVVIGDVVSLRERLAWFERSPLFGKRVLITRPADQSVSFAHALLAAGAKPVIAPAIRIAPAEDASAAERATRNPSRYAWIVFTSASGVRDFFSHVEARREDARIFGSAKIAAIGLATSDALAQRNVFADFVPQQFVAEDLADGLLAATKPGDRILLYRAAQARDVLPDRLREAGRTVDVVTAYRVELVDDPQLAEKAAVCDILTFTSSSTVRGFAQNLGDAMHAIVAGKTVACIGPITAQTARDLGLHVDLVAHEFTVNGLLDALMGHALAARAD